MTNHPSPIAKRIQEIRKARKLSRQQLAEKLGTTYLQIYRVEKGVTEVSADDVPRFADVLKVDVATLYGKGRPS